ncbi:hypothetical protein TNIN_374931 [Trichonephila inaurata madagascariensis]|uniref:Uncharacterized protein n=1 Tax=Trichonephila inaurata madagascariensis TaxID=2747483 RepID=A0A8X7CRF1_9ARAC|nr:hypothetical protein TNIN_374931 [Trichonephila inaurata madagascariensis]
MAASERQVPPCSFLLKLICILSHTYYKPCEDLFKVPGTLMQGSKTAFVQGDPSDFRALTLEASLFGVPPFDIPEGTPSTNLSLSSSWSLVQQIKNDSGSDGRETIYTPNRANPNGILKELIYKLQN